jgi:N-acetylglucosamine kinase-like BadF-type ATPase
MSLALGIDIGGTGSRVALGEATAADGRRIVDQHTGPRIEIGPSGSTVLDVIRELVRSAADRWADRFSEVTGIGIGATGIASLAEDPADALVDISAEFGVPAVAAIDAVTAHLGALGGLGGAVTVLGTGAIAIAHPGPDEAGMWTPDWSRADGWGHLFGDRGGGAWLGRHGLEIALRTYDGVDSEGRALLEAATRRFGPPALWPGQFYTRGDRAGLLAEFAADIADLSRSGDAVATELLAEAGAEAAQSAIAAARRRTLDDTGASTVSHADAGEPLRIGLTGGLTRAGGTLVDAFRSEALRLHNDVIVVEAAGDPLTGALTLAHLGAGGSLRAQTGVLWI